MSQIEDRVEKLLDETKTVKLRSRWPFRIFVAVLLLAMAGGLSFFTLRPQTYTATAYIQVLTQRPYFIYSEQERMQYDQFVETQFAIMRSPLIVDKTLEDPEVARMPTIKRQRDKAGWLAKNLKLQRQADSEMITISISTPIPEDSAKIVNAVVEAFFVYYAAQSSDWNHKLIMQLNLEYNRQQAAARLLQDEIRSVMEQAAKQGGVAGQDGPVGGFAHTESLLRDIYLNEAKLVSLQAELEMLREVTKDIKVPQSAILRVLQNDPDLRTLNEQRADLQVKRNNLKAVLPAPDDPKIQDYEKQIAELEKRLAQTLDEKGEETVRSVQSQMLENFEQQILEKEMAVRAQEIFVKNLKAKYKEQLANIGDRTTKIVDLSFQQAQLKRINGVLDLLQERITKLETERYAPEQIQLRKKAEVPPTPDRRWFW